MLPDNDGELSVPTTTSDMPLVNTDGHSADIDRSVPAVQPAAASIEASMKTNFVLIDYENIQPEIAPPPNGDLCENQTFCREQARQGVVGVGPYFARILP